MSDSKLKDWITDLRKKFDLTGQHGDETFWDGYETAIEDLEDFIAASSKQTAKTSLDAWLNEAPQPVIWAFLNLAIVNRTMKSAASRGLSKKQMLWALAEAQSKLNRSLWEEKLKAADGASQNQKPIPSMPSPRPRDGSDPGYRVHEGTGHM